MCHAEAAGSLVQLTALPAETSMHLSMSDSFAVLLQSCPPEATAQVVAVLGRAFGIKEGTAASVVDAAPIILVGELSKDEAACLSLVLRPLILVGADLIITDALPDDLPKIDWPRRPLVFKQNISDLPACHRFKVPVGVGQEASLLDLLHARLEGSSHPSSRSPQRDGSSSREVFTENDLGEITPFSNPVLPAGSSSSSRSAAVPDTDLVSRMNEIFPDEDGQLIPNANDISSILDQVLPDDEPSSGSASSLSGAMPAVNLGQAGRGSGSHAVFLAKIADENRRKKAVPLLAELAGMSDGEAEALSKKIIIPVLKGVSKDEAETAKQRFAEIGVLARIKAG